MSGGIGDHMVSKQGCDNALVEKVGRTAVLEICTTLGCRMSTMGTCVPYSGPMDLCQECYTEAVKLVE